MEAQPGQLSPIRTPPATAGDSMRRGQIGCLSGKLQRTTHSYIAAAFCAVCVIAA